MRFVIDGNAVKWNPAHSFLVVRRIYNGVPASASSQAPQSTVRRCNNITLGATTVDATTFDVRIERGGIERGGVPCGRAHAILATFLAGGGTRHQGQSQASTYVSVDGWRCEYGAGADSCFQHGSQVVTAADQASDGLRIACGSVMAHPVRVVNGPVPCAQARIEAARYLSHLPDRPLWECRSATEPFPVVCDYDTGLSANPGQPDASRVEVFSGRGPAYPAPPAADIWFVLPNHTVVRQITSTYPQQVRAFTVRAAAPEVAYIDDQGVWTTDAIGHRPRRVLRDAFVNALAFSRDGTKIAYARAQGIGRLCKSFVCRSLSVMNADGSGRHAIFVGTENTCNITSPSWAPDGRWIAFTLCTDFGGPNEKYGVWLIRPDGRDLHLLTMGTDPTWSPDGRWIAFVGFGNPPKSSVLFRIQPTGRGRVQLTPNSTSIADFNRGPSW